MGTKSYYGLSSTAVDVGNADNLTATGGGSSLTQTPGSQTFDFAGWMELNAHGGVTGVHGAINPPDGHGWTLDTTELVGVTLPAGTWQFTATFFTSAVSASGDMEVRFYDLELLSTIYTALGSATLTGQTITTGGTKLTFTAAGLAAYTQVSGHVLIMDIWWHQVSGGSSSNLLGVQVASTANGVPAASGGFELVVPWQTTVVNGAATGRITLTSKATIGASGDATGKITLSSSAAAKLKLPLPTIPPAPMPLLSVGVPAFSNATSYPAGNANDNNYGTTWRSASVPSIATPYWLALDLSTKMPKRVLLNILNEQGNLYLEPDFTQASSLPKDYLIQANMAAGGGNAPTTGWVTLQTITGNSYSTVQHLVDMTGYNWLRIYVTASAGVSPNDDVNFQLDVHDASFGAMDRWLVLGDSITLEDWLHPMVGGGAWGYGGATAQLVNSETGNHFYPATIDGGNGGMTTSWAASNITGLLNGFSGGFVILAFGTNDCIQPGFTFTAGDNNVTTYYSALLTCIDAAEALNNVVIVPYIPWGSDGGFLGTNAGLLNDYVNAHLKADRPGVFRGPDFWTFFDNNPNLLRSDGIHPTFTEVNGAASGHENMHMLYADWMVRNIYTGLLTLSGSLTLNDVVLKGSLT